MKFLKYAALCLATVSCTQTFSQVVFEEVSPVFDDTSKLAEWFAQKNITSGSYDKRDIPLYIAFFDCNIDTNKISRNYTINQIIAMLPEWLTSTISSPQYQASRCFTKQFTLFGLLDLMGLRSEEKNGYFCIKNDNFTEPGTAQRDH